MNFSEPLSFLQRLTEDFEYSECLDRAAECDDSCQQMAYVAAFTVSTYANTTDRTGKPFNPLLGETYECDRVHDFGWRSLAEQVSASVFLWLSASVFVCLFICLSSLFMALDLSLSILIYCLSCCCNSLVSETYYQMQTNVVQLFFFVSFSALSTQYL